MMESWHKVGQKVICVDDAFITDPLNGAGTLRPKAGQIYTIRGFEKHALGVGFLLTEIVNKVKVWNNMQHPCEQAFGVHRFRPVRETSIEQFRTFLTPTPEVRRALEDA